MLPLLHDLYLPRSPTRRYVSHSPSTMHDRSLWLCFSWDDRISFTARYIELFNSTKRKHLPTQHRIERIVFFLDVEWRLIHRSWYCYLTMAMVSVWELSTVIHRRSSDRPWSCHRILIENDLSKPLKCNVAVLPITNNAYARSRRSPWPPVTCAAKMSRSANIIPLAIRPCLVNRISMGDLHCSSRNIGSLTQMMMMMIVINTSCLLVIRTIRRTSAENNCKHIFLVPLICQINTNKHACLFDSCVISLHCHTVIYSITTRRYFTLFERLFWMKSNSNDWRTDLF